MKLFEPVTIKGMTMNNRIVMPAMQLVLGLTNARAQAYYLERARGGVGAIIMAATSVDLFIDDQAWGREGGVSRFISAMGELTAKVKSAGSRIGIQLWHGNQLPAGNGSYQPSGDNMVAPSAADSMRELTAAETKSISGKFARASARAREAGFDFIELHGAHGYLLCQFFSAADNRRTDDYGGDLHRRMRFSLETVQAVRQAVGDDFPIFYRLGAREKRPDGITLKQSKPLAKELERAGVDAINVSLGRSDATAGASPGKKTRMGVFASLAEKIKSSVSIPVIAVGRINTPEIAEAILSRGQADLVAVGRQLIADPEWPSKVRENRFHEVLACESCNTCFRPLLSGKWKPGDRICKVNERAGREIDFPARS